MSKRKQFPKAVHFGFRPDGTCVTLGHSSREGAWSTLLFHYAAEVKKRSHVITPEDDVGARKANWSTGRRKLEGGQ